MIDVSALAPGPFCTMLLADFGADVIAVERPGPDIYGTRAFLGRGKRSITVDLKAPEGPAVVARLSRTADVFVEGNRPGTMERLGLGPDDLLAGNPGLVYARVTGWGQSGPYAGWAGHDINYIAIGGALGVIGQDEPVPPANLVGDFASGSLMAAMGILLALFDRSRFGQGQVVDAAMVDGAALLITAQLGLAATGQWGRRGSNLVDGSAPFYGTYRCADGGYVAVGAVEPQFWVKLLAGLGLPADDLPDRADRSRWPELRKILAARFLERTRDEWVGALAATDACLTPVLDLDELTADPHLAARATVVQRGTATEAAPAPRLGRTPGRAGPPQADDTDAVLTEAGYSSVEIDALRQAGTFG